MPFCCAPAVGSGADGRFEISDLGSVRTALWVHHPSWAALYRPDAPAGDSELTVQLTPGRRAVGRLVGPDGPVSGKVVLTRIDDTDLLEVFGTSPDRGWTALAGDDGRFTMAGLPRARLTFSTVVSGHTPRRLDVAAAPGGETIDLGEVRLAYGRGVHGRVLDNHRHPIADASVNVEGQPTTATSDEAGRFAIPHLDEPAYRVCVLARAWAGTCVIAQPDADPVEVVLQPEGVITGAVVNEAGRPVSGTSVSLRRPKASRSEASRWEVMQNVMAADATTLAYSERGDHPSVEGRFRIAGIAAGTYDLGVHAPDHLDQVISDVRVDAAGRTDVGTVVVSTGRLARLLVVDPSGVPVANARLSIVPRSAVATTGHDGRVELRGLPPAPVTVHVRHPAFTTASVKIPPGGSPDETRVALTKGGRIEGTVHGARPGLPTYVARLGGQGDRTAVSVDGTFAFPHAAPGRATLLLMTGRPGRFETLLAQDVIVQDEGIHRVEMTLRDIRISGVVTRDDTPVVGQTVHMLPSPWIVHLSRSNRDTGPLPPTASRVLTGTTDTAGRFDIVVPGPGRYRLWTTPHEGAPEPPIEIAVPDAAAVRRDIPLSSTRQRTAAVEKGAADVR